MRVHELAKILGISSDQIRKDLKRYHVTTKSHMSAVDDKAVKKLLALYEKRRAKEAQKAAEEKKRKEEEERKRKEEEKKRREEERRRKEEERRRLMEEERKRREEEKRKRLERERQKREAERLKRKAEKKKRAERQKPPKAKEDKKPHIPEKKREPAVALIEKEKPLRLPKIEVMSFDIRRDRRERDRIGKRRLKLKKQRRRVGSITLKDAEKEEKPGLAPKTEKKKKIRPTIIVKPTSTATSLKERAKPMPRAEVKLKPIKIRGEITVGNFAEKIGASSGDVIKKLLELGEPHTINQVINYELCELLADEFGVNLEIIPETDESDVQAFLSEDTEAQLQTRPPVVTIMGHVDHGKTTLLDKIRQSDIVGKEFGSITQHIGAYYVSTGRGGIVFVDTPGHEAFTAMRARGAKVTDIVILVVAANDGVMPQTIEAINHARAANVPIIVAINKIDLPDADQEKVKQQLINQQLVPEELGGDTIFVNISAKKAIGIDHLLEMILLQAEMMELKANPNRPAIGVVIESHIDPLRGAVATVLIQNGILKVGDNFVAGTEHGRVRTMRNDYGYKMERVLPSFPAEIIGFNGVPEIGEGFVVVPDERTARAISEARTRRRKLQAVQPAPQISLESLHELIKEGKIKELKIIIKADVQGSVEVVCQSLEKLSTPEIKINFIHSAVGPIIESDVDLAIASRALIVGFNVRPEPGARELAEKEGVEIKLYRVIYELIDDMKKAMVGLLEPKYKEVVRGRAEIKKIFKIAAIGNVAGCVVLEGEVAISHHARLIRDNVTVYEGTINSLRRLKDDVTQVVAGQECGISLADFNDIKEADIIETYELEEIEPQLEYKT